MRLTPIHPFEPISTGTPPAGDAWVSQIKWDGVRMLVYYDGDDVRLFNRQTNERTGQYPEFQDIGAFCRADSVILDGEMIAFDQSKPSFHEIMRRDGLRQPQRIKQGVAQVPVTYMIFDILYHDGEWITGRPLSYRQQLLNSIMTPRTNVQLAQNFPNGGTLFELMKQRGMEGVIYKDLNSAYGINGKDGRWRKQKAMHDLNAVIGGVTYRDRQVNALLLGLYAEDNKLVYIGHAGTGRFTQQDWAHLTEEADRLRVAAKPFANEPERSRSAVWLQPELAVRVEYLEFTPGGTMRHPSIQALVDRADSDCTVGQIAQAGTAPHAPL